MHCSFDSRLWLIRILRLRLCYIVFHHVQMSLDLLKGLLVALYYVVKLCRLYYKSQANQVKPYPSYTN